MKKIYRLILFKLTLLFLIFACSFKPENTYEKYKLVDGETKANVSVTATSQNRYPSAIVDSDNDGIINWVLEPNLWNVVGGTGNVSMTWNDSTGLSVAIHLTNVVQESTNGWVNAYPEIWYGSKTWNSLGPATDGPIPLPRRLSELNNFSTTVTYSVNVMDTNLPYNFCFETWLVRDTTRDRRVRKDEVEIMIWLDYYDLHGAGEMLGTVVIDGKTYEIWRSGNCGDGWEYFAFRPTTPSKSGTITINWGPFIREAMKYSDRTNWPAMYLGSIELGSEFGSPNYLARNDLEWRVSSLVLSYGSGNILQGGSSSSSISSSSISSSSSSSVVSSSSSIVSSRSSSVSSSSSSIVSPSSSSVVSSSSSSSVGSYVTITLPFSYDGAGEFYWKTDKFSTTVNWSRFVNSWNVDILEINGVNYANKWVAEHTIPPASDGFWYIRYKGSYPWSHFEAK